MCHFIVQLIRNTNVLVGVHGAGLMFIMFAADEVSSCFLQRCKYYLMES